MIRVLRVIILLLVSVTVAKTQNSDKIFVLSGTVYDQVGALVANTKVTARNEDGRIFQAISDDNGYYEIRLPIGKYKLEFYGSGFKNYIVKNFSNSSEARLTFDVNFIVGHCADCNGDIYGERDPNETKAAVVDYRKIISATTTVSGKISEADTSDAVPLVEVTATDKKGKLFRTISMVSGVYKLELPAGDYKLEFERQCFKKTVVSGFLVRSKGSLLRDITLERGWCNDCGRNICEERLYVITGIVRDQNGAIIPRVKVEIVGSEWQSVVKTDDDGAYFAELPAGDYEIKFSKDGHKKSKPKKITLDSKKPMNLDIQLFAVPTPIN